jgi:hypothetical protein
MSLFSRLHRHDNKVYQFKTGFDPWTDYDYKLGDKIKWEPDDRWPGCHIDGVLEGHDEGEGLPVLIVIKDCTIVAVSAPLAYRLMDDAKERLAKQYDIQAPPRELWPEEAWDAKAQREAECEFKYQEWCEKHDRDPNDPGNRIGYFTRIRMEEDGFYRRIMPTVAEKKK